MRVVVGQWKLDKEDQEEMIFNIEELIIHENWNNDNDISNFKHDIALLKVRRKGDGSGIQFTKRPGLVRPACLPQSGSGNQNDNMKCTIAGWGSLADNSWEESKCMRHATVPLIAKNKCQNMFSAVEDKKEISEGMPC